MFSHPSEAPSEGPPPLAGQLVWVEYGAGDGRTVRYSVPRTRPGWELTEEPLPESVGHYEAAELLRQVLLRWVADTGRDALVARNLAVRWDREHPQRGADPDLCLVEPAPRYDRDLGSILDWQEGHHVPKLAVEIVSNADPRKDYEVVPDKYAACGVDELWVFDPLLVGPRRHGGPFLLQQWRRRGDALVRIYQGAGPFYSPLLGAHIASPDGKELRPHHDPELCLPWPTREEAEVAERDRRIAERDRRIAELEERLAGGRVPREE